MERGSLSALRAELARIDAHIIKHEFLAPGHDRLLLGGEMPPMKELAERIVDDIRPVGVRIDIEWVTPEEYALLKALKGLS